MRWRPLRGCPRRRTLRPPETALPAGTSSPAASRSRPGGRRASLVHVAETVHEALRDRPDPGQHVVERPGRTRHGLSGTCDLDQTVRRLVDLDLDGAVRVRRSGSRTLTPYRKRATPRHAPTELRTLTLPRCIRPELCCIGTRKRHGMAPEPAPHPRPLAGEMKRRPPRARPQSATPHAGTGDAGDTCGCRCRPRASGSRSIGVAVAAAVVTSAVGCLNKAHRICQRRADRFERVAGRFDRSRAVAGPSHVLGRWAGPKVVPARSAAHGRAAGTTSSSTGGSSCSRRP